MDGSRSGGNEQSYDEKLMQFVIGLGRGLGTISGLPSQMPARAFAQKRNCGKLIFRRFRMDGSRSSGNEQSYISHGESAQAW